MDIFFLGILAYLLYRFLTGFLIPVFRTTRQVHEQFNQMKGRQTNNQPGSGPAGQTQGPGNSPQHAAQPNARATRHPEAAIGEYIDFEEVKN